MTQPSFFPGNLLLLEKARVTTSTEDAKLIQSQIGSDLTTMKSFPLRIWSPAIVPRYAADPLVMELLFKFEASQETIRKLEAEQSHYLDEDTSSLADEPQTWQSIFP